MKNLFLVLLTFTILLTTNSCEKEQDLTNNYKIENPADINPDISPSHAVSPSSSGDIHTRITEFCYDKIVYWRNNGLTNDQIRDRVYDDVFIRELSRITGYSRSSIANQLRYGLGLTKSNMSTWSIYSKSINNTTYNALYNDLQSLVDRRPTLKQWSLSITYINNDYSGRIPADHLETILDISSSSYRYWYYNYDDWIDIPNSATSRPTPLSPYYFEAQRYNQACSREKVVGGDIRGAIGGLLSSAWSGLGAIGGMVTGAMVGTLVGAVDAAFRCKN